MLFLPVELDLPGSAATFEMQAVLRSQAVGPLSFGLQRRVRQS